MQKHVTSISIVFASVFAVSFMAYGQLGGPNGVRIPYNGTLEVNGGTANGPFDFRFSIYNVAVGGSTCDTHAETLFVNQGKFAVTLGPIDDACVRGQDIFVGIEVSTDVGGVGYTALAGRQRIFAAPSAATSGSGDFAVQGRLDVEGGLGVGGQTTLNTLSVAGATTVGGTLSSGALTVNGIVSVANGAINGSALASGTVPGSKLASDPIACDTWSATATNSGGGVRTVTVAIPDSTYARTGGGCNCGSSNPGRLLVQSLPINTNQWQCQCKDHVANDAGGITTAYVIGCRLR